MASVPDFTSPDLFTKTAAVEIETTTFDLRPRHAFRIARPREQPLRNVFVRITAAGAHGFGEASPNGFYGESAEQVLARIAHATPWLRALQIRNVADLERAWSESWEYLAPSRAAQCALDLALWDWLARCEATTVSELALGAVAAPVQTFCTLGLSTASELRAKLEELHAFPQIKVKSDATADLEPIRTVRAASTGVVAVDANASWSGQDLCALSRDLRALDVAFLEQPLPPTDDQRLPRNCGCLPIVADESCVIEDHVDRLAGRFDGFNIKLVKCGGLTPALRMARRGRALGLKTMVGCMIETSALIAAGAVVAQLTDYADLDGAWLLSDDLFTGWHFDTGVLHPPQNATGLGVALRPESEFAPFRNKGVSDPA